MGGAYTLFLEALMKKFVVVSMAALFALFVSIPMASAQTILPPSVGEMMAWGSGALQDAWQQQLADALAAANAAAEAAKNKRNIRKEINPIQMATLTAITQPDPVIGEAWTDLDGDGVNDNGEDNCLDYPNPDQDDIDGDDVGDDCDVCPEDPNPAHQELDDCAWSDDEYDETEIDDTEVYDSGDDEVVGEVEEDLDVESGEMSYFDLSEEEFDDAMTAGAAAGAGCSLAQATPAINALGIALIAIGLLQILSRRRK